MKLDSNNHSVFKLHYHLIMVTKYRRQVISGEISAKLRQMFESIGKDYYIVVEEWGYEADHVHVIFRAQPHSMISKFLNAYKSASSRVIKTQYPQIRSKLWKEAFWSKSYCLLTTGGAPPEVIKQYVISQGAPKDRT